MENVERKRRGGGADLERESSVENASAETLSALGGRIGDAECFFNFGFTLVIPKAQMGTEGQLKVQPLELKEWGQVEEQPAPTFTCRAVRELSLNSVAA